MELYNRVVGAALCLLLVACGDATSQPSEDTATDVGDTHPDAPDDALSPDVDLEDTRPPETDDALESDVLLDSLDSQDTDDASETADVNDTTDAPDIDAAETQVIDPLGDSDQDGVMDLDEVEDGTDPFDPRSVRSLRPDIEGHPRLFVRPDQHAAMLARSQRESGPAQTLWARVLQSAQRPMPVHPLDAGYNTSIPPTQGQIAEAAALVGWVTGDLTMTTKALEVLAAEYPDPAPLNQMSLFNAGNSYNLLESEALAGFCSAYDLAAGTPGADPTLVSAARDRLVQRVDHFRRFCMTSGGCTTLLRTERNNHSLKSLSALGLCAMAIPDHPKAVQDFHDAFAAVRYLAHEYQGDPQGGWAESWNYLSYSGDTHLSFHHAIHRASLDRREPGTTWRIHGRSWLATEDVNYGKIVDLLAPTHDPLWRQVYVNGALAAMPSGNTAPVDDANVSSLHGGLLATLYDAPVIRWNWELPRVGLYTGKQLVSTFLGFDPDQVAEAPVPPLDMFLADAGFSVLRSSLSTDASWLYVQHEPYKMRLFGSSHEHADPLSFIVWARGEPLAIDPGYIDYANHGKVKYGKDHNIVLVDGKGPEFFLDGLIQAPPNSDGFLHDHAVEGLFTTLAASTKYENAELRRRFVRVDRSTALGLDRDARPDLFIVADRLISETSRNWTFQLNGLASELIGGTSFTSSPVDGGGQATWTRPLASLIAITLSSAGTPLVESRLEESSLASGNHRCFTISADMGANAGFLTALIPLGTGQTAPTSEASRLTNHVTRIALSWPAAGDAGDGLIVWLNTGTEPMITAQLPSPGLVQPGLTVLYRVGDAAPEVRHYTMNLPPIPDPSPFIP
jgi:hypothetical protein